MYPCHAAAYSMIINMKLILLVLIIVVGMVGISNAAEVRKCRGENAPFIDDLKVELGNCTTGRCQLVRGQSYRLQMKFTAVADADNLASVATGKVSGQKVLIRGASDPHVCNHTSDKSGKKGCPLKKGKKYVHETIVVFDKSESKGSVDVQWDIKEENKTITCFEIPIKLL